MMRSNLINLMNDGGLRVPAIQRDYVMGRPEGETIEKLRCSISWMFKAVFDGVDDPMYFVYGFKDQSGSLMLLDGQQRLTSLFLLAWFLGQKMEGWKFEYSNRRIAQYFVSMLMATKCLNKRDPWSAIVNSNWFLPSMLEDATVNSIKRVLEEMARMYAQREKDGKNLIVNDIESSLKRITFSVEGLNSVSDAGRTFDDVFLKMNARGLPLTDWERMKCVMDRYGDEEWQHSIDGEWMKKYWEMKPDIGSLNQAFEKIVRLSLMWESPELDYGFSLLDLDKMLSSDEALKNRAFTTCKRYFKSSLMGELPMRWAYKRAENSLWCARSKGKDDNFLDFTRSDRCPSHLERLRFAILCSDEYEASTLSLKRSILNVIDAFESADVTWGNVKRIFDAFIVAMRNDDLISIKGCVHQKMVCMQMDAEMLKRKMTIEQVGIIDTDPLVYKGRVTFLLWDDAVESFEILNSNLKRVKEEIKTNFREFFVKILAIASTGSTDANKLPLRRVPIVPIAIHDDESERRAFEVWGREILWHPVMANAIKCYCSGSMEMELPQWLIHLNALFVSGDCKDGALKQYEAIYVIKNMNLTPDSMRLDVNKDEADNREKLLGVPAILYLQGEERFNPRPSKDVVKNGRKIFYQVWNAAWRTATPEEYVEVCGPEGEHTFARFDDQLQN